MKIEVAAALDQGVALPAMLLECSWTTDEGLDGWWNPLDRGRLEPIEGRKAGRGSGRLQKAISGSRLGSPILRLVGPLHLRIGVAPAIGAPLKVLDGPDGGTRHIPILTAGAVGISLRFSAAVRPDLGLALLLAPNPTRSSTARLRFDDARSALLLGPMGHAGIAIPLGQAPISLRAAVEGGHLHPFPFVRGVLGLSFGG